jgi:hypothetical protein
MARLNMALGRCAVNRRRNRREAGKSLGDDPVAVRLKHVRGDVPALRQRNDAALGLLPCEYAELAKGAQENVPQHSDASPSPINGPAAEKLAKQLLELRPPRMEALEPRFFTAMAKVIMAYVDIDEQRQRTEKVMEPPPGKCGQIGLWWRPKNEPAP